MSGFLLNSYRQTPVAAAVDLLFSYNTLLLNGDSLSNNAYTSPNTRFFDQSSNNYAIQTTGSPAPTQGSFSPFTQTCYSVQFNGTTDFLSLGGQSGFTFGTNDFTIEGWFWFHDVSTRRALYDGRPVSTSGAYPSLLLELNGTLTYITSGTVRITSVPVSANTWYHIALVRSNGVTKLYVNGSQSGSAYPDSTNYLSGGSARPLIGGNGFTATNNYKGYISNLRVVNGTAVYPGNFAVLSTMLTPITNTVLLTCQTNRFKDSSTYAYTVVPNGAPKIQPFNPFLPLTAYSANTNPGGGISFNGISDCFTMNGPSAFAFGTGDFTIESWVYFRDVTAQAVLYDSRPSTINGAYVTLMLNTGSINLLVSNGYKITASTPCLANVWYHLALVRSSGSTKLYINGVQSGSTYVDSNNYLNGASRPNICVSGYTVSGYFNGIMSDLHVVKGTALYTSTFTPPTSEITKVSNTVLLTCQSSGLQDNSVNNFPLILVSGPVQVTDSPYIDTGYSCDLGNLSGYITTPASSITSIIGSTNANATSTFTIECWINQTQRQTDSRPGLIGDFATTFNNYSFSFGPDNNGKLSLSWYDGTAKTCLGSSTIPLNVWTHIALSIDNGNIKLFVNGVLETMTGNTVLTNALNNNGYLAVARNNNVVGYYGYISNLRIVKSALYSSTFTPSTAQLTAITGTGLLTFQSNRVIDNSSNALALSVYNTLKIYQYNPFTVTNSASWDGGGMLFNGVNNATTPTSSLANIVNSSPVGPTSTFTIEGWIYQTQRQTDSRPCLIGDMTSTGGTNNFSFGPDNTGKLAFYWYTAGSKLCTGSTTIPLNAWTHIAVSISAGVIKLFVNGNLETLTGTTTLTATSAGSILTIGRWNNGGTGFGYYGYLSNLRVSKAARYSASFEVPSTPVVPDINTSLMLNGTAGTIVDYTRTTNIVSSAAISTSTFKFGTGSLLFPGSAGITGNSPDLSLGQDFTVECWINFSALGTKQSLFNFSNSTTSSAGLHIWKNATNQLTVDNGITTLTAYNASLVTGVWYHLAVVKIGTTVTIYINGNAIGANTVSPAVTSTISIGKDTVSIPSYFNGYMDDIRVTNGIARYSGNFTPANTALPLY